jgi:hypothetical protein
MARLIASASTSAADDGQVDERVVLRPGVAGGAPMRERLLVEFQGAVQLAQRLVGDAEVVQDEALHLSVGGRPGQRQGALVEIDGVLDIAAAPIGDGGVVETARLAVAGAERRRHGPCLVERLAAGRILAAADQDVADQTQRPGQRASLTRFARQTHRVAAALERLRLRQVVLGDAELERRLRHAGGVAGVDEAGQRRFETAQRFRPGRALARIAQPARRREGAVGLDSGPVGGRRRSPRLDAQTIRAAGRRFHAGDLHGIHTADRGFGDEMFRTELVVHGVERHHRLAVRRAQRQRQIDAALFDDDGDEVSRVEGNGDGGGLAWRDLARHDDAGGEWRLGRGAAAAGCGGIGLAGESGGQRQQAEPGRNCGARAPPW